MDKITKKRLEKSKFSKFDLFFVNSTVRVDNEVEVYIGNSTGSFDGETNDSNQLKEIIAALKSEFNILRYDLDGRRGSFHFTYSHKNAKAPIKVSVSEETKIIPVDNHISKELKELYDDSEYVIESSYDAFLTFKKENLTEVMESLDTLGDPKREYTITIGASHQLYQKVQGEISIGIEASTTQLLNLDKIKFDFPLKITLV